MYDYGGIALLYRRRWYRPRRKYPSGTTIFLMVALLLFVAYYTFWLGAQEPVIRLWRTDINRVVELPMEEYVAGVLAAEMPADFALEALKAGAVAARSYAIYEMQKQSASGAAHVSSDYRTSQAWISPASLIDTWGLKKYLVAWPKIKLAVHATRGQVLTYQGEVAQSLYHSTSGGVTANSEDYYIAAVPYLRSVPSPWETHSPYWQTTVTIPEDLLLEKLGLVSSKDQTANAQGNMHDSETAQPLVEVIENYPTGRTKSVRVGSEVLSSRQVREKLGLRSSWFTVTCQDGQVTFYLRGNGHGVGMSQYGADGLARMGYKYDAILRYYYQGTRLQKLY